MIEQTLTLKSLIQELSVNRVKVDTERMKTVLLEPIHMMIVHYLLASFTMLVILIINLLDMNRNNRLIFHHACDCLPAYCIQEVELVGI